jgi:hypothetical protein
MLVLWRREVKLMPSGNVIARGKNVSINWHAQSVTALHPSVFLAGGIY